MATFPNPAPENSTFSSRSKQAKQVDPAETEVEDKQIEDKQVEDKQVEPRRSTRKRRAAD